MLGVVDPIAYHPTACLGIHVCHKNPAFKGYHPSPLFLTHIPTQTKDCLPRVFSLAV
jgi:hypothetical protein